MPVEHEGQISGEIRELLQQEGVTQEQIGALLGFLHPVDVATLLEDLRTEERERVFGLLDERQAAAVLAEIHASARRELLEKMPSARMTELLGSMRSEHAADVSGEHPVAKGALESLATGRASEIRELLEYAPRSAGGVMSKNFVTVPPHMRAADVVRVIQGSITPDTAIYVYVVDEKGTLLGIASLRALMLTSPDAPVRDVMRKRFVTVRVDDDREEAGRKMARYRLHAMPVVDEGGVLRGVIPFDDAMRIQREEAAEDLSRVAGVGSFHPTADPIHRKIRARLPWLLVTLLGLLLLAWMMKGFEGTLHYFPFLAFFLPVTCAMGGSFALQSSTVVVRGLATGELTLRRYFRFVRDELVVGVAIGVACGLLAGSCAYFLQGQLNVGLVIWVAMGLGIFVAGLTGSLIPVILSKLGADPALAAGPFITVLNDITCVVIYLTVATSLLL